MPERLLRLMRRVESALCIGAFVVLVLVIFADVVSRELTSSGLYWAPRIGVWANVLVVMAGFGLASADGAHLRPRFADHWWPRAWLPVIETLQHVVMAAFSVAIGLLAARVALDSWRLGEVSIELFWPVWPVQALLPLAFFAAAVRHAIYALRAELRPREQGVLASVTGAGS